MEIRNLKTFLKVATLKNFTSAAKELGYSQANVSAQIKQLEQELDAPLFNRIGRKVTLTQYAEDLLPYALDIVSTAVEMENLLHTSESLGGTIRVGMVESLFHAIGEDLIRAYHKRFPRVSMDIVVDGTPAPGYAGPRLSDRRSSAGERMADLLLRAREGRRGGQSAASLCRTQ